MDQKLTFEYTQGDSKITASFESLGDGTMAHIHIGIAVQDNEEGHIAQEIEIDTVLDSQFHMILEGLTSDQADALDKKLLEQDSSADISRQIKPKLLPNGTVERRRTIEIGGQAFGAVFGALAAAIPLLTPLVADLGKINNPVWLQAYEKKDPFFGGTSHRAQKMGDKDGTAFECEKLTLWVANDGADPEFWILFKDDKDSKQNGQTASRRSLDLALALPANNGGATMYPADGITIFKFTRAPNQPGNSSGITDLERVIGKLHDHKFLSPEEAERLALHQSTMGQKGRRINMSNLVGVMQATRARISR